MPYPASAELISTVRDGGAFTESLKIEHLSAADFSVVLDTVTTSASAGTISSTHTQESRRTLRGLTIANPSGIYTPTGAASDVFGVNNVVRIWRGIYLPSTGLAEYVPIGTFRLNRPWVYTGNGEHELRIDGQDLWKQLMYTGLHEVLRFNAGAALGPIFRALLAAAGINQYVIHPDAEVLQTDSAVGAQGPAFKTGFKISDAFGFFARVYGWRFYFDPLGVFQATPFLYWNELPSVYDFLDTHISVQHVEGGYEDSPDISNHVGVRATNPDGVDPLTLTPLFAEAQDGNAASITYVGGSFGDRYSEYEVDWAQSKSQLNRVAQQKVREQTAMVRPVTILHTPYPWLYEEDPVTITWSDGKMTTQACIVSQLDIPLDVAGHQTTKLLEVRALE